MAYEMIARCGISLDDLITDRQFLAESISESEDGKFSRFSKAVDSQDANEVGQLYLDMVDEYYKRTGK